MLCLPDVYGPLWAFDLIEIVNSGLATYDRNYKKLFHFVLLSLGLLWGLLRPWNARVLPRGSLRVFEALKRPLSVPHARFRGGVGLGFAHKPLEAMLEHARGYLPA